MTREVESPAGDAWLVELRPRLLSIARRRVPGDEAEDLVQSALGIILERAPQVGGEIDGLPSLAWCMQVLRNVIGNYYKRTAIRRRFVDGAIDVEKVQIPIEGLGGTDRLRAIEQGLDALDGPCRDYLRALADGAAVTELADAHGLESNALYQRLYRCRRKLREILRLKGVLP